jgi:c-di-GMP-binding flagellar brake protein YcgR
MAQVQRVLGDPATADRLVNVVQTLSNALLDLPVGGMQAALEGRIPMPAERHMTVRDMARQDNPNFDRKFERQVAQARPMVHQGMNAMSQALPEIVQGLKEAERGLKRAAANMPDPDYPKR